MSTADTFWLGMIVGGTGWTCVLLLLGFIRREVARQIERDREDHL